MASLTNNASADSAMNGLGSTTHILTVDDVSAVDIDTIRLEAETEGFTVVAIEASNSGAMQDADLIAVQGTGTPSFTGCTLLGTFVQRNRS
jgi:hypothetical protein